MLRLQYDPYVVVRVQEAISGGGGGVVVRADVVPAW